eukprot:TRINITY_DN3510_c0_g1_i1.p1 TRINITY_DN3510_c0_g1~~TRINITY_DN3510_c0_g1_i1.p1  ORF type:complete len:294 (-),score=72.79 TRINITY_DN3510_c0_g1_i1:177-1058(-)
MATTEALCEKLQTHLKSIAPNLRPQIAPRGYVLDSEDFLSLLMNLFPVDEHAKVTELILECGKRVKRCSFCQTPGQCLSEEQANSDVRLVFSTEWDLSFTQKTFGLTRIVAICQNCSKIRDLNAFLETAFSIPTEKILALVQHFLTANKCTPDADDVEGMRIFQECYSVAYSLKLIGSNLPVLIPKTPFDDTEDKVASLDALLKVSFPIERTIATQKKRKAEQQSVTAEARIVAEKEVAPQSKKSAKAKQTPAQVVVKDVEKVQEQKQELPKKSQQPPTKQKQAAMSQKKKAQ